MPRLQLLFSAPLVALLALLTFACSGGDGDTGASSFLHDSPLESAPVPATAPTDLMDRVVPLRSGDLRADLTRPLPGTYREPSAEELQAFEGAFARLLAEGATPSVQEAFTAVKYAVSLYRDAAGTEFLVLEDSDTTRNGGTYVVNLMPARELIVEAPHGDSDEGTAGQSTRMFFELGARALLLNGTHRCASDTKSECSPENSYCGDGARVSDAAHNPFAFFTGAHRALRGAFPEALAASIHGMETDSSEAAVISDGTETLRPGSIATRLRDALNTQLANAPARAFSCNEQADQGQYRPLCGTTNAQAKFDNASVDACVEKATQASDKFLHVEQSATLRMQHTSSAEPDAMTGAMGEVVACSLGGPGLGCEGAAL